MFEAALLTAGGLLSAARPIRRHLDWLRWQASLRAAHPVVPSSPNLDQLVDQAAGALDRR